ncbi:MAG: sulfate adenylyltransferase [Acidihalobacter sp.]|uniref:sulfate adenylyltransferase n=1 Tax=Acidihalobacter sp. TaxID=1872108 RepID=UPI00307E6A33
MTIDTSALIAPHGGRLVDLVVPPEKREAALRHAEALPRLALTARQLADLECLATGVYSPLDGFMGELDYRRVLDEMRLADGTLWPIPVVFDVDEANLTGIGDAAEIALSWEGRVIATLRITERYEVDKPLEASAVYGVDDAEHPGVAAVRELGDVYLAGPVRLIEPELHGSFDSYRYTPAQSRAEFARRGWRKVAAFQTRNPIHRAHEYLQKVALETVDGLFVHPLVGQTKSDDIPDDLRIRTYEVILERYYPQDRIVLGVFPAAMRYAGPREALKHAIARQNYGCSHFIVGRDHAGVGNYYGTYDAQRIFETLGPEDLRIIPLPFENAAYCTRCAQMATRKTCPHPEDDWLQLSGSKVRAMLREGVRPPVEFTRPEVADLLMQGVRRVG